MMHAHKAIIVPPPFLQPRQSVANLACCQRTHRRLPLRTTDVSWSCVVKFIEVESSAEVGKVHVVFRMRLVFQ